MFSRIKSFFLSETALPTLSSNDAACSQHQSSTKQHFHVANPALIKKIADLELIFLRKPMKK
jgi:glycerol dehydrogenase-like iron-containing ADH family enzyme